MVGNNKAWEGGRGRIIKQIWGMLRRPSCCHFCHDTRHQPEINILTTESKPGKNFLQDVPSLPNNKANVNSLWPISLKHNFNYISQQLKQHSVERIPLPRPLMS